MPFRNLKVYRLSKKLPLSADKLEQLLEERRFSPCSQLQMSSMGWVSPLQDVERNHSQLVYAQQRYLMICLQEQQKLLPASVVNDLLREKLDALERQGLQKPGRKQKKQLKEDLILELLPRAFAKNTVYQAYFDLEQQLLLINTASQNKAEQFCEFLRQTIGSLPIVPFKPQQTINQTLTAWLQQKNLPAELQLGQQCELFDPAEDGGVIRCRNLDLNSEELQAHIHAGKQVSQLRLIWNDSLEFTLYDDLSFRAIKYTDIQNEKLDATHHEDALAAFDAQQELMMSCFAQFLDFIRKTFQITPA